MQNVLEYALKLCKCMDLVGAFAKENLEAAKYRQEQHCNKRARLQVYQPGDQMLLLLPSSKSKVLVKRQGLFKVLWQVRWVDYEIHLIGKH